MPIFKGTYSRCSMVHLCCRIARILWILGVSVLFYSAIDDVVVLNTALSVLQCYKYVKWSCNLNFKSADPAIVVKFLLQLSRTLSQLVQHIPFHLMDIVIDDVLLAQISPALWIIKLALYSILIWIGIWNCDKAGI